MSLLADSRGQRLLIGQHACRAAFGELFAGQAGQLAERMGRLRQKETAKREGFLKHAEVRQRLGIGINWRISVSPEASDLISGSLVRQGYETMDLLRASSWVYRAMCRARCWARWAC